MLDTNTNNQEYFDLELRGNKSDISNCLNYLKSLNITVIGKGNTEDKTFIFGIFASIL